MNHVGERIRKFRLKECMSEQEVADSIGMSQNAYHKKEVGDSKITVEELAKIAQVLEQPLEELLKDVLDMYNLPYNSNNHQPEIENGSNGDFAHERKVWEELLAAQKTIIQKQAEEIAFLKQENERLKGK